MNSLRQLLFISTLLLFVASAQGQTWDESTNGGGDAGSLLTGSQDLTGSQYALITGSLSAGGDVDLYKISILDPSNFSATTVKASYAGGDLQDSWLFLFDSSGNAVYSNDESPVGDPGFNSLLAKPTNTAYNPAGLGPVFAGTYYVAVGSYEEQATNVAAINLFEDPRDFSSMWQRMNAADPTATGTLKGWTGTGLTSGSYEITLSGVALPVEFSSLDATTDNGTVTLRWTTLSESNNAGFDVEFSSPDRDYQSIGFVQGHGTTTERKDYVFGVQGLGYGTHSFRLRQVNYDGSSDYSPAVEVELDIAQTYLVSTAYPNPFVNEAQIEVVVREEQDVTVELYNVLGQRVATLFDGRISENESRNVSIDGSSLANGQYLVRVKGDQFRDTQVISLSK